MLLVTQWAEQGFKNSRWSNPKCPFCSWEGAAMNGTGTKAVQSCCSCLQTVCHRLPIHPTLVCLTTTGSGGSCLTWKMLKDLAPGAAHRRGRVRHRCDLGRCCGPAGALSSCSEVAWAAVQSALSHSQCQGLLTSKQETVTEKLKKHMIP